MGFTRSMRAGMCSEGVARASTRTTPFRTVEVVESLAEVGTIPGHSIK